MQCWFLPLMSFGDKLKFWKAREETQEYSSPPVESNEPLGMGMNAAMAGMPQEPSFAPQAFEHRAGFPQPSFSQPSQPPSSEQQIQLISAKLDTIKAQLETVLQRLDAMERKNTTSESAYQQRWRNV